MKKFTVIILALVAVFTGLFSFYVWRLDDTELLILSTVDDGFSEPFRTLAHTMSTVRLHLHTTCPDDTDQGISPVGWVAEAGNTSTERSEKVVSILLDKGCHVDEYSDRGLTPLHSAILTNKTRLVAVLLSAGSDPFLPTLPDADMESYALANLNAFELALHLQLSNITGTDFSGTINVLNTHSSRP